MSDGLTDANRDQERNEKLGVWLDALIGYLEGNKAREDVDEAANEVAGVRRGLLSGPLPQFRVHSDRMAKELARGDEKAWREFVENTAEAHPDLQDRRDAVRKQLQGETNCHAGC